MCVEAVRRNPMTSKATDSEVNTVMNSWRRGAIDRNGGRALRAAKLRERRKRADRQRDGARRMQRDTQLLCTPVTAAVSPGYASSSSLDSDTLDLC